MLELIALESAPSGESRFIAYVRTRHKCIRPLVFRFIQDLRNNGVSLGAARRHCVIRAHMTDTNPNLNASRLGHLAGYVGLSRKTVGASDGPVQLT